MTGDPTLSPTAGIGPTGLGLGVASWKREMELIFESIIDLMMKAVALTCYLELYRVLLQQQLIRIHVS